jgi:hypothetical protein
MRPTPWLFVTTTLLLTACIGDGGIEDGVDDAFTTADGKADGYDLTEAQALAVMHVAGSRTESQLRAAGVAASAARAIARYVAGPDGRRGTADDQELDSLAELDAIDHVGPRALESLLAAAGSVDERTLGRHDVSILVPLPASGDLPWRAAMTARGGALLPRDVFARIDRSVFKDIEDADEYDALRVVGVRFDPCFTMSLTSPCQPQLRLVFQALSPEDDRGTVDGAVHALYNLTTAEHTEVTESLRSLTELAPQNRAYAPLGISPSLRAQGMSGAYAQQLGAVITRYAGAANLARITFVTRTGARQGQWELGGFHIRAFPATGFPAPGPITIHGDDGDDTIQLIGNRQFGPGHRFSISPAPLDPVASIGLDSSLIAELPTTDKARLAVWAFAQNSPRLTVPDTTDCASCHIAGHVSTALEDAGFALAALDGGPRVVAGAERMGDNLRAFGYFGKQPMVSIRTANETAAVLRALR